ncbi:iev transmembrane phosphoprotein [Skunkpox virus]|uniref:Iev transmembrane phosphoprotein n=1 Tax=Skunkpox virus TaxID=160796 RepID=A0A1C9KBV2_9POXV|nr:iev transmembrane phosphoprotein [Skunkpox virus]AOP31635.1 iev transmembrane phosphoprotein [Skunkpox virus]
MILIPLITVTVAGTILACYILYICRKRILSVYNNNKIITTKLKKIKNSNSSNSSKSNDSESDWEDHCSAMEKGNDVPDNVSRNSTRFDDDDSFAGSLTWDNESNIVAPSTEHIYDSVAGSTLMINNNSTQAIYQNTTVIDEKDTIAALQDNPIYQSKQQNPNYSSNPFINYNKTHFKSNPFIAENTTFSETNPFRRAYSEDCLNNQDHTHDGIESSIVSLV